MSDRYQAIGVQVSFMGWNAPCELCEENDPYLWDLADHEAANSDLTKIAVREISQHLEPFFAHLISIGCIRADIFPRNAGDNAPTFFLISRGAVDCFSDLQRVIASDEVTRLLSSIPGASISIQMKDASINPDEWVTEVDPLALYELLAPIHAEESVAVWGGPGSPERLPLAGEPAEEWLARVAIPTHTLLRTVERWEMSGRDPDLYGVLGGNDERVSGSSNVEWLVHGRIARGVITSVVANNQAGKSSLLHEWGAALSGITAGRARSILGQEVQERYVGVLVFAEDPEGRINERAALLAKIWGQPNYFVINASSMTLDQVIEKLRKIPHFDYVAIDPVRALMPGNEDSSEACNTFYGKLGALADERNCSVIVTHHLTKGHARYLSQMLAMVRGSGVHTDRPRMVIGLIYHRTRDLVEIGPIKHNLGDTVWLPINQGQFFRWDRYTSTSVLIDETAKASVESRSPSDAGPSILGEIARLNKLGILVRRSGKAGLFEMRLPGLAARPRSAIVDGLRDLLASGSLVDGSEGLQVRRPASDAQ